MKRVAIIAFDGCWAMSIFLAKDFFHIVSLLERHYQHRQSYQTEILTSQGEIITSASGSQVIPDGALSNTPYDLIIIPPVEGKRLDNMPAAAADIINWLKPQIHTKTSILTLSTGAYFLAASNSLTNATLATHWAFVTKLTSLFPANNFTAHPSYLKHSNIFTTGSLEAGTDVLLKIIADTKGDRFSQLCATHLLVSEPAKLKPFLAQYRHHTDQKIEQIQNWIDRNFQHNILIADLAKLFGFSERNVKRRFQKAAGISIIRYLQELRIDKAKKLLLSTRQTIKDIALEVGYENDSFFCRLFKRHTDLTPAQWRADTPKHIS